MTHTFYQSFRCRVGFLHVEDHKVPQGSGSIGSLALVLPGMLRQRDHELEHRPLVQEDHLTRVVEELVLEVRKTTFFTSAIHFRVYVLRDIIYRV